MLRFVFLLSALWLALPVQAADDDVATTLAVWKNLRDPDSVNVDFTAARRFLSDHPGWPEEKSSACAPKLRP